MCIPLRAIKQCQKVKVEVPKCRKEGNEGWEKQYQFEIFLQDEYLDEISTLEENMMKN